MRIEDYKPMLCPVCGDFYFSELQEGDELPFRCSHCGWVYDSQQHENPDLPNGENALSMNDYRKDYQNKLIDNPDSDYSEENRPPRVSHTCPVCEKYEFEDEDCFDICPFCGWEDDSIQLEDPDYDGGANTLSLNQYREEYQRKIVENPSYRWDKNK